jgi:integrase/recombinase XerC
MLRQHITAFLRYLHTEKRYSPNTLTAYGNDLEGVANFLGDTYELEDAAAITHHHLRSWMANLRADGLEARSLNRKVSSLSSFFRFLMREGVLEKNPAKQIKALRTPERLPQYLKENEAEFMLGELQFSEGFAGATERLLLELLYACGLRRAEVTTLREEDIEWSLRQIRVTGKGGKERIIPVSAALLDDIRAYREAKSSLPTAGETLLVLEDGKPLYAMWVYRVVKHYLGQVSTLKKRSPHVLRHSFATHLLANGANIQAIRDLLGHASLAATQVYTHTSIDKLKDLHKRLHPRG